MRGEKKGEACREEDREAETSQVGSAQLLKHETRCCEVIKQDKRTGDTRGGKDRK